MSHSIGRLQTMEALARILMGFQCLQGSSKHPSLAMQHARHDDLFQNFNNHITQLRNVGMMTGRRRFDSLFLPVFGVPQNVAELGAGEGEFALEVANKFPNVCYWAVDKKSISQFQRASLPSNLYNCSPCEFAAFLRLLLPSGAVPPFDLVYMIMPLPQAISDYVEAATRIVASGGLVHMITEDQETLDFAKGYFRSRGLETRQASLAYYLMPNTYHIQGFIGVEQFHWLIAR